MERSGDSRRAGINGLQRRRAGFRDSREVEGSRQVELQEMGRLRDREVLPRKHRDRESSKRRKVERQPRREHESSDSSDEEYDEDGDHRPPMKIHHQNRMNPPPPAVVSASRSNHRRSLRTLRSTPVPTAHVDELIGVPVPRRARSSIFRRGHDNWSNGSGGLADELSRRRFSASPATASPGVAGGSSPSSSGGSSMKKKRKSVEPRNRTLNGKPPTIQDDIEFEVAEALFDLMKQSQSSQNADKDGTSPGADDEGERFRADDDVNGGLSVRNEESMQADAVLAESNSAENDENGEMEKEMRDADEQVEDELLLNKEKAVSPKENEAPSSSGKVNAGETHKPVVTKTVDGTASVANGTVVDLTASLTLSTTPEMPCLLKTGTNSKDVQEEHDTVRKEVSPASVLVQGNNGTGSSSPLVTYDGERNGTASSSNQLVSYDGEIYAHDSSTSSRSRQQKNNLLQNSLMRSPESMNGWPGVLAPPGCMMPPQAVMHIDGGSTSSSAAIVQAPEFRLSEPRKKCGTHQYIARNIKAHQQLVKTSLLSAQSGATEHLCGGPKEATILVASRKDISSDVAKSTNNRLVPQQVLDHASAQKLMQGPALAFPFGHHQMAAVTPASNTSGQYLSVAAIGDASMASNAARNFCLPSMSFNHQNMPTNEPAYLAMLQKSGLRFPPIPGHMHKNGNQVPMIPFFNSSTYSAPGFNVNASSGSSSRKAPHGQKQTGANINDSNSLAMPFGSNTSVSSAHNLHMLPNMPQNAYQKNFQASDGKSTAASANLPDLTRSIFGKSESNGAQSLNFNKSGCGDVSATMGASMFDGLARNTNMVPSALTGKQVPPSSNGSITIPNFHQHQHHQQLIQVQKQHMQQMQLNGGKDGLPGFLSSNFPGSSTIFGRAENPSFTHQWDNMPRTTAPDGSSQPATSMLMSFPQHMKGSQGQTHISFGNMPGASGPLQGQHIGSSSPISKNAAGSGSQRNPSGPSQQADASQQNGSSQKSSPACRRNVASILSTCTSQQPSELK